MSKLSSAWSIVLVRDVFRRLTEKNKGRSLNVLTISAQKGLISQQKYFNKLVSSENVDGYYYLDYGTFAYNKSYSAGYPLGVIKRQTKYKDGIVSPLYICFSLFNLNANPDFYLQYFESGLFNPELNSIAKEGGRGHGLLNVSVEEFFDLKLPMPPLNEQKKIAEILTSVDRVIELTTMEIDKLKDLKKGMMQEVLTKGIGNTKFKDSPVGKIPESWEVFELNKLAKVKGGKRLEKGETFSDERTNFPYLRVTDMREMTIIDDGIKYITKEQSQKIGNYKISKDDLYITVAGTLGLVGEIPSKFNNSNFTENADKISEIKTNIVLKEFLLFYLQGDKIQLDVAREKAATGVPKLALHRIESFEIAVPPIKEQEVIIKYLKSNIALTVWKEKHLNSVIQMKKGLMNDLLTGKVRVKV